jgi:hypothetical protein
MGHLDLTSLAVLAYRVAVSALVVATGFVLWQVVQGARRAGRRGWMLAGQELVWTLIPALLLAALTVAGDLPRQRERGAVRPPDAPGGASAREAGRAPMRTPDGAGSDRQGPEGGR